MRNRPWTLPFAAMAVMACAATISAPLATAATPPARLVLTNYPGDAPGTMSIDTIAKSTACQERGYLRYSTKAHHCVNT